MLEKCGGGAILCVFLVSHGSLDFPLLSLDPLVFFMESLQVLHEVIVGGVQLSWEWKWAAQ